MFPITKIDVNTVLKRPPQNPKIKSPYKDKAETFAAFVQNFKPDQKYTVKLLLEWHYYLTASCPQGRVLFCHVHNLKRDTLVSVKEFFELTQTDVWGCETMIELEKQWREAYHIF